MQKQLKIGGWKKKPWKASKTSNAKDFGNNLARQIFGNLQGCNIGLGNKVKKKTA